MTEKKRKFNKFRYRKQRRVSSIYFLLWAVFSVLCLSIVLFFGFSQRYVLKQTYKNEAEMELGVSGRKIQNEVLHGKLDNFDGNRNAQLRYLSEIYDARVYLLNADGEVIAPVFEGSEISPISFKEEIVQLKNELSGKDFNTPALYEGEDDYCYGARIELHEGEETYLLVTKSLSLMNSAIRQTNIRMWISALFVFVVAFAVSSAVSGWLTRPISEIKDKAIRLADRDFAVNFHGADYTTEIVELADALNYARDELSKTDKMQKELIANISHDFKTPLTMIKAYASMIKEISGDIPEKRNKHAQVIEDEADKLTSLVTDVLDLSKITSGIDTVKPKIIDMSSYLKEIIKRFDYFTETQGYEFIVHIDEGLYTAVDEVKISQALYNLIGNAVNYTGEDKKVFIRLIKQSEEAFVFAVTDTGAGINKEELAHIWERYYRAKETHKRPVKGTGLGLSIVKAVLDKHRLEYGADSIEGQGTTFYIRFPLQKS